MEQFGGRPSEHEGERYLRLLGLGHLADNEIITDSGTIQAREFLDICGEHARPILVGFEAMSTDDPKYEAIKKALRSLISRYVEGEIPS